MKFARLLTLTVSSDWAASSRSACSLAFRQLNLLGPILEARGFGPIINGRWEFTRGGRPHYHGFLHCEKPSIHDLGFIGHVWGVGRISLSRATHSPVRSPGVPR